MKELKEFTVERLSEIAMDAYEADPSNDEMQSLAKIALTAKQAKPVAITDRGEVYGLAESGWVGNFMPPDYKGVDEGDEVYLYTTPPLNHTEQHMVVPDGWIKCSDRSPIDNGIYICWDGHAVKTYAFLFGNWQANQFILPNITHWMPRPAAPKPESE
ncbi:DUF551 domain-containing protein [Ewingella sp. CoE-038-23]|uniref:DUF551 domain-containing protein n=1 Tax=Ewingella docleensis TaxID=3118588 RepID=UPI0033654BF0